ncbi:EF-hand domain pair [Artemisia annua]|uniref:EF-hand domain pair n=1 Tax=Artemisia annua TaxID=35608 RepID=A0A2U1QN91_ARTAN|nr:EF-hand domain pair [Artemisia annua]
MHSGVLATYSFKFVPTSKNVVRLSDHICAHSGKHLEVRRCKNVVGRPNEEYNLFQEVQNHEKVTTAFYVAPEVLRRRPYGKEVDIWSAGVILYKESEIVEAVQKGEPDMVSRPWPFISSNAKNLVRSMLSVHPNDHPTTAILGIKLQIIVPAQGTAPHERPRTMGSHPGKHRRATRVVLEYKHSKTESDIKNKQIGRIGVEDYPRLYARKGIVVVTDNLPSLNNLVLSYESFVSELGKFNSVSTSSFYRLPSCISRTILGFWIILGQMRFSIRLLNIKDYEIIEQIERDVKRTHSDIHFFSGESAYAKGIRYAQGMNEILAPFFHVFKNDPNDDYAVNAYQTHYFALLSYNLIIVSSTFVQQFQGCHSSLVTYRRKKYQSYGVWEKLFVEGLEKDQKINYSGCSWPCLKAHVKLVFSSNETATLLVPIESDSVMSNRKEISGVQIKWSIRK